MRLTKWFPASNCHVNHVPPALEPLAQYQIQLQISSLQVVHRFAITAFQKPLKERKRKIITNLKATDVGKRPLHLSENLCDQGSYDLYKADACLNAFLKAVMAPAAKQLTINYKD